MPSTDTWSRKSLSGFLDFLLEAIRPIVGIPVHRTGAREPGGWSLTCRRSCVSLPHCSSKLLYIEALKISVKVWKSSFIRLCIVKVGESLQSIAKKSENLGLNVLFTNVGQIVYIWSKMIMFIDRVCRTLKRRTVAINLWPWCCKFAHDPYALSADPFYITYHRLSRPTCIRVVNIYC